MKNNISKKRKISVKYTVPKIEELKRRSEYWAKKDNITLDRELDIYIRGRIGDIQESTEKISKEYLRISKSQECINLAVQIMEEKPFVKANGTTRKSYLSIVECELSHIDTYDVMENGLNEK